MNEYGVVVVVVVVGSAVQVGEEEMDSPFCRKVDNSLISLDPIPIIIPIQECVFRKG